MWLPEHGGHAVVLEKLPAGLLRLRSDAGELRVPIKRVREEKSPEAESIKRDGTPQQLPPPPPEALADAHWEEAVSEGSGDDGEEVPSCPNSHGPLKPWKGHLRCWTCGWQETESVIDPTLDLDLSQLPKGPEREEVTKLFSELANKRYTHTDKLNDEDRQQLLDYCREYVPWKKKYPRVETIEVVLGCFLAIPLFAGGAYLLFEYIDDIIGNGEGFWVLWMLLKLLASIFALVVGGFFAFLLLHTFCMCFVSGFSAKPDKPFVEQTRGGSGGGHVGGCGGCGGGGGCGGCGGGG